MNKPKQRRTVLLRLLVITTPHLSEGEGGAIPLYGCGLRPRLLRPATAGLAMTMVGVVIASPLKAGVAIPMYGCGLRPRLLRRYRSSQ